MEGTRESLVLLRDRVAALHAPLCGMAHESVRLDARGRPIKHPQSDSGYSRPGLCQQPQRAVHLGCSHTMARYVLRDALDRLPGDHAAQRTELLKLDAAIGLLDHRRYAAECRRAAALEADAPDLAAAADAEIAQAVAEHRRLIARILALRDDVLRRLDAALTALSPPPAVPRFAGPEATSRFPASAA